MPELLTACINTFDDAGVEQSGSPFINTINPPGGFSPITGEQDVDAYVARPILRDSVHTGASRFVASPPGHGAEIRGIFQIMTHRTGWTFLIFASASLL